MITLNSCKTGTNIQNNPLLGKYNTPFNVPPFGLIKPEHFLPALEYSIKEHTSEVDSIIGIDEPPTFENTVLAFDRSGRNLKNIRAIFSGLKSSDATEGIQKIAGDFEKRRSEHNDNIYMNTDLFKRIETVYAQKDSLGLDQEQLSLLLYYYKRFVRNGAKLSEEKKLELKNINTRLIELSNQFDQNLLAETNSFKLVIENKDQLS